MAINCTVSGSFNKHLNSIFDKVKELEKNGIVVLSPKTNPAARKTDDFVYLEGDIGSPREIELMHLNAISRSDFLYVVNPEGHVGKSTLLEIGYALSKGIKIFSSDKITDPPFNEILVHVPTISNIREKLANESPVLESFTLFDLQKYVKKMVAHRGFDNETIQDVLLLLVEEIGELAKAIREQMGLKVNLDDLSRSKDIRNEIADCLIYLIDLANLANVDLQDAFIEKENTNKKGTWGTKKDIHLKDEPTSS